MFADLKFIPFRVLSGKKNHIATQIEQIHYYRFPLLKLMENTIEFIAL